MQNGMINVNQIGQIVSSTILTTAMLANKLSIALKGEFILPEEDYLRIVPEFQRRLATMIMPAKTAADVAKEADKFIAEIVQSMKEDSDASVSGESTAIDSVGDGEAKGTEGVEGQV